jgi:cytidylate kinase
LVTRTIRDIAATQDAVIVGRAGHVSLANQSGVLRVLCVASEATRIARVMKAGQLSPSEARHRVHESDRDSRDFHAEFFHSDWMDPRAYDLVISTDALAVDQAVEAIVAIARTVHGRPEPMSHALHH